MSLENTEVSMNQSILKEVAITQATDSWEYRPVDVAVERIEIT